MRRRIMRILTVLAVISVILAAVYFVCLASSTAKLQGAYAALEKAGRPMHKGDVIPEQILDEDNAALLYESAILLLRSQNVGDHGVVRYLTDLADELIKDPLNAAKRKEAEEILQWDAVANALEAIKMGAERPACRFEVNYGAGLAMMLPPLSQMRGISRVLALKAHLQAQAGQMDEAWDMARTQLRYADALRNQPTFVCQLVRFGQMKAACQSIRTLCDTAIPSADQHDEMDRPLMAFEDISPLIRAADGERLLFGEATYDLPKEDLKNQIVHGILGEGHVPEEFLTLRSYIATFKPILLADHAAYLRAMKSMTERLNAPYDPDEDRASEGKLFQEIDRHRIAREIIPASGRLKEIYLRTIAETRVTRGGLALLRYKQAHGAFPETLAALTLQDRDDPFRDGPLQYRAERGGFVLYSIGADLTDNGGQPHQKNQSTDFDIVWRFQAPIPK